MGTAWTDHVTKFFKEQKLNNPEYTFKQALKEAGKTFKKGRNAVVKGVMNTADAAEGVISLASRPVTRKRRRRRGKSHKKSHGKGHKKSHGKSHKKRRTKRKSRKH